MATVVLVGTLDTKGAENEFVRDRLRAAGVDVLVVDTGVLEPPAFPPDITRQEVAAAPGAGAARSPRWPRGPRWWSAACTRRAGWTGRWRWAGPAAPPSPPGRSGR